MSQAITKIINLQELLSSAIQETIAMTLQGIDISDPSVITPLEWTANQYPEIAPSCNEYLIELVKNLTNSTPFEDSFSSVNEF